MALDDLFKTAPQEVIDYFDRRPSRPSFRWDEVAPREHALNFTVARTAGFDVIDDIRAAARKAVVEHGSFERFRDELVPVLRQKGWWGERRVTDPRTGEIAKVQLGSLRRLALIYDANIRSAQAAGDWVRIQRVKEVLPYLEYLTSTSERKRPLHLSWVGTTLPVDDAWWSTHYPPNGWRCKCRVRSRAEPRAGASTERPPLDPRPWTHGTTGETRLVPAGIDPGWDSNPGLTRERLIGRRLVDRLDGMGGQARREAVRRLRQDPVMRYVVENGPAYRPHQPEDQAIRDLRWPVAVLPDTVAARLGTTSRTASLTVATAEKQLRSRKPVLDVADYDLVQEVLDAPDAEMQEGASTAYWRVIEGKPWKLVLKRTGADEIFLTSFRRDAAEQVGRSTKRSEVGETRSEGR